MKAKPTGNPLSYWMGAIYTYSPDRIFLPDHTEAYLSMCPHCGKVSVDHLIMGSILKAGYTPMLHVTYLKCNQPECQRYFFIAKDAS